MARAGSDRAIQVFGAMGISPDTSLGDIYISGRALRIVDGPDEVHLCTVCLLELRDRRDRLGQSARYLYVNPDLMAGVDKGRSLSAAPNGSCASCPHTFRGRVIEGA